MTVTFDRFTCTTTQEKTPTCLDGSMEVFYIMSETIIHYPLT
jgi:hypothetical protein